MCVYIYIDILERGERRLALWGSLAVSTDVPGVSGVSIEVPTDDVIHSVEKNRVSASRVVAFAGSIRVYRREACLLKSHPLCPLSLSLSAVYTPTHSICCWLAELQYRRVKPNKQHS